MKRLLLLLILLSSVQIFAQETGDSLFAITDSTIVADSVLTDSLSFMSDSLSKPKPDTLKPIKYTGFTGNSASYYYGEKEKLNWEDYRSFGELTNYLPGGFFENPATLGNTGEIYFYGLGYQEISAAIDGNNINNQFSNSYNFYNFDYENIEGIEIPGPAKGFLYNMEGNPVYLNFIKSDSIRTIPYTRVRYFQGQEEEGLVSGYFSRVISGRLSGSFGFNNIKAGQRYENTDGGGWNAFGNLKYVYNNNLNFFASYHFYNTQSELNGGVDISQVEALYLPADYNAVIYNGRAAPVVFPYQSISLRYEKYQGEKYNFRTIARFFGLFYTQLDIDYSYNKIKFRQNERNNSSIIPRVFNDDSDYSFNISLRQKFTTNLLKIDMMGSFRHESIESTEYPNLVSDNYFLSADAQLEPFDFINLNLFAKTGRFRKYNVNGSGIEATIAPVKELKISAAVSYSEQAQPFLVSVFTAESKPVRNVINQITLKYKSGFADISSTVFTLTKTNHYLPYTNGSTDTTDFHRVSGYKQTDFLRVGAALNARVNWHFLELFLNPAYNYTEYNQAGKFFPELTFTGGIYYRNIHFNNNLHVKTGFNFRYNTGQLYSVYDYEKSERIYHALNSEGSLNLLNAEILNSGLQIDFMLAGELQESAIIYFVFENLLDQYHYVLPYYPMWLRGFRLGFNWKLFN